MKFKAMHPCSVGVAMMIVFTEMMLSSTRRHVIGGRALGQTIDKYMYRAPCRHLSVLVNGIECEFQFDCQREANHNEV